MITTVADILYPRWEWSHELLWQWRLQVVGEVAYTRCRDSLSVIPRAGGETTKLAGDRVTIYRKQPDGRWLLARDAHTLSPVTS